MQYTIEINGSSVSASQLNMVLTIDKTLDYGSFAVRNQTAEPYAVGDMVDIDITDGTNTNSYHFIVDADDVTQLPGGYYLHTVNIIELTKLLEWQTETIRTFTQKVDYIDPKTGLLVTPTKLTLLDVLVQLQFTTPIEKVDNLGNTRVFAIDNNIRSRFAAVETPDFQFNNKNLKEILIEIFDFVDAIPRLTKISDSITLTADFYNNRGSLVTEDAFYQMKRVNINDYSTSLDSNIQNLYDTYTEVAEPSPTGTKKLTSDEGYLTEDNAYIKTQYPIVDIVSLKIKVDVTGTSAPAGTPSYTGMLDITKYILEKEAWDLLPNKKFSQGLVGQYRDNTLYFNRFNTDIDNLFEQVGAVSIGETIIDAFGGGTDTRINTIIKSAVLEQEGFVPVNFQDYNELEYQIVYKAQINTRTEVKRLNTDVIKYDSQTIVGQTDNVVRADRVLDRLFKLQQLLGNAERMTSERTTTVAGLLELGDYTSDDYVLTTVEMDCTKEYIMAKYMWSLRYQKVSEFISLNNEIRLYPIPLDSFKRNIYLEDFVEVGLTEKTNTSSIGTLGLATFMNGFSNSPLEVRNRPIKIFGFNSESIVGGEIDEEVFDNDTQTLIKPITAYSGGNSLNFHVEFDTSTTVGAQLDEEEDLIPVNRPILYTNNEGVVYDFEFIFANDYSISDINELPIVTTSNISYKHVESDSHRIYKDTREIFALTYALHVIPEGDLDDKIIIGKYLVERNNLLKTLPMTSSQFEVVGTNTPYTLAENRFSRTSDIVLAQTYTISGAQLSLSSNITTYTTWAIRKKDTKELVIAVNQGATPIGTLWFNFRDKQTGVIYPSQTSQPSSIVKRPTQIALIPPSNNPTGSTIDIVWVDGNTDPVADEFEISISDDLVNWTAVVTQAPGVTNAYQFTGLEPFTRYTIRIRARIGTNFSEYAYFQATTTAPAPPKVENLTLTLVGDRRIFVEWDEADDDIFSYRIEASASSGFSPLITGGLKQTFFTNTSIFYDSFNADINYDTTYYFRVRALRDGLFGPYSDAASVTTVDQPITAAPIITNVSSDGTDVTYTLINADSQLVTLFSDLSNGSTQRQTNVRPNEAISVTQSYTNSDSTIFAKATSSGKDNSEVVSFQFEANEPPNNPTILTGSDGLSAIAGFNILTFRYSAALVPVDGFVVERNPNLQNTASFGLVSDLIPPVGRNFVGSNEDEYRFIDSRINSGQSYTYRVKSINRRGEGTSTERTITSAQSVPNAPSSLSLVATLAGSPGEAVVAIEWTRNSTDENGFLVQRKESTQGAGSWADVGGTSKGQTYFEDIVVGNPNTNYDYRILAYNEFGNSTPSNTLQVNVA